MDFQVKLLLLALVFCSLTKSQAQTCGDIGTNAQEFTESRERKFFLNTQEPAPCDGTVDQFEYCYYLTDQTVFVHLFTFAVYRETSPGSNTYSPISDPFNTGTYFNHGQNNFTCRTFQAGQTIQIQADDMIGACIYDPPNGLFNSDRAQLDVVGQQGGTDRFLMSATDNSGCSNSAVPNSVSGLSRADSFVMHIYASIVPIPTTTPPALATTTVVPTPMISEILTSTVATLIAVETSSVASIIVSTSSVEIAAPVSSTVIPIISSSISATSSTGTPIPSVTRVSTIATLTISVFDASTTSTPDVVTSFTVPTTTQAYTPTTDSISTSAAVTMGTLTSTGVAIAPTSTSMEAVMSTSTSTAQPLASSMQEASSSVTIQSSMVLTTSIPIIATSSIQDNIESPERTSSLEIQITATFPPPQSTEESTMATTASSTTASSGGMTVIIIAIVVVIVIIVTAVAIVIFFLWVRKRRKRKQMLQLTPGFVNVMYTTRKSTAGASNEAVVINDIYEDTNTTDDNFKEDLESTYTYASGTYDVAMGTYDVPTAVTSTSPLFDSSASYAECGPNDKIRAQSTPYGDATVKFSDLLGEDDRREIYDQLSPYQAPASKEKEIYGQLKSWGTRSIPRSDIQIVGHLGSGQYGSVDQGIWKAPKAEPVDVALKSLTKACEEDRVKFLQEAAIMAQFRHPNVIELYGVVIQGTPTLIVGELATRGDLRTFLHKLRKNARDPNLAQLLLKCSYQVALGMEYLSAKGFVHRDLAARNVLVTEDHICKIADFGMSRDLADENYYVSQGTDKIPVKWTAPEALHYKKYSTASDVWSYGCLLYEIWSIGHKPLEGITNQEAIRLIDSGKRLSPPPGCPKMIYELMILCWHPQTMVRPTFQRNVLTFVGNGDTILEVPKKDSSTNPLAGVLGAPLEAGENMYSQLQRRYRNYDHRAVVETDDDYFNPTSF